MKRYFLAGTGALVVCLLLVATWIAFRRPENNKDAAKSIREDAQIAQTVADERQEITPEQAAQAAEEIKQWIRIGAVIYRTILGIGQPVSFEETEELPERLTEEMAIEYTRRALKEKGYDVSAFAPVEYRSEYPEGQAERYLARNTIPGKENQGYVLWGPAPGGSLDDGATYFFHVNIEMKGNQINCEIYHRK